ncbi:MAG: hypothetical protein IT561_26670, partial [Alphaproteobacteria bacterium]|nr:hypothetical protein [Alphaproteobacteria bacterium]
MRRSMIQRALVGGSLAAALVWSGGASAQTLIVDPQHIAHCLCLEQSVAQRA